MSKFPIIIVLLIFSCEEKKPIQFPQLSTDPIEKAYAINNVSSYVELDYFNGDTLVLDSVHLNEYGYTLTRTGLVGWDSNSIYDYDSLNRLIKLSHDSDISYEYFITYDFLPTQHEVIEKWFETISNDTVLFTKYIYSFDDKLEKILSIKRLDDKEDYSIIEFKYNNGRIIESHEQGQVNRKNVYTYLNNKLNQIRFYQDDKLFYVDYISLSTGLKDSTLCPPKNQTIVYKYHYSAQHGK